MLTLELTASTDEIWAALSSNNPVHWLDDKWYESPNVLSAFCSASERYLRSGIPPYCGHTEERGIVICAGGVRLLTNAWVCVNMLRHVGCTLPIEIWHLGPPEFDARLYALMAPFDVRWVDAYEVRLHTDNVRTLNGYEVKAFAIKHSRFREVMLIDADNVAVKNPEYLFETMPYQEKGVILWPDYGRLGPDRLAWTATGVPYVDEPEVESGQIVVDRERCWNSICLAVWYNSHSDFLYNLIHGDKETFHLAFRKTGHGFAMPERLIHSLRGTMCQHDFSGERVFQHRNMEKWRLHGRNARVEGFRYEKRCKQYIKELRAQWNGTITPPVPGIRIRSMERELEGTAYRYIRIGYDERRIALGVNGSIKSGVAYREVAWGIYSRPKGPELWLFGADSQVTCRCKSAGKDREGVWVGRWEQHEKMPVELVPVD